MFQTTNQILLTVSRRDIQNRIAAVNSAPQDSRVADSLCADSTYACFELWHLPPKMEYINNNLDQPKGYIYSP